MGRAIYRKLGNKEALKKYGRSSFVFVGGTGLIPEQVPGSNDTHCRKEDDSDFRMSEPETEPKRKG